MLISKYYCHCCYLCFYVLARHPWAVPQQLPKGRRSMPCHGSRSRICLEIGNAQGTQPIAQDTSRDIIYACILHVCIYLYMWYLIYIHIYIYIYIYIFKFSLCLCLGPWYLVVTVVCIHHASARRHIQPGRTRSDPCRAASPRGRALVISPNGWGNSPLNLGIWFLADRSTLRYLYM